MVASLAAVGLLAIPSSTSNGDTVRLQHQITKLRAQVTSLRSDLNAEVRLDFCGYKQLHDALINAGLLPNDQGHVPALHGPTCPSVGVVTAAPEPLATLSRDARCAEFEIQALSSRVALLEQGKLPPPPAPQDPSKGIPIVAPCYSAPPGPKR
jgi:hypothetical protein